MVKNLAEIGFDDILQVGGKAASLGEMTKVGIPVPSGYVVTTDSFHSGMSADLEQTILSAFDDLGMPRVAVRSSAVAEDSGSASWAGQLESYLNVTRDDVIDAVQRCWQSIGSDHAAAYGKEQGMETNQQSIAVIIQAMVDSEISGVLFTANPVTQNRDEIMIEAVYGLGELLVQGTLTPENVIVNKVDGSITSRSPSKQRTKLIYQDGANIEVGVPDELQGKSILSESQIKELSFLSIRIEQHYGKPQDIEWAILDETMYIVQSRPVTTLSS